MSIISIDGSIGSGKTTLALVLAALYDARLVQEDFLSVETLPDFYRDPERYALETELAFLRTHRRQFDEIQSQSDHRHVILDFAFARDLAFARVNLASDATQFSSWMKVWREMERYHAAADVVIFLSCPIPELLRRIKRRQRTFEDGINSSYLTAVDSAIRQVYSDTPPKALVEIATARPVREYAFLPEIEALFASPNDLRADGFPTIGVPVYQRIVRSSARPTESNSWS